MTLIEYVRQVRAHRRRMAAYSRWWLPPAIVRACAVHDVEKWLFLPLLFAFHGGRGNRKVARAVYDAMNAVGRAIRWFALLEYEPEERARAIRFERVADVVDRHMDPVAGIEMGQATPPPITCFLAEHDLPLAEYLKAHWQPGSP